MCCLENEEWIQGTVTGTRILATLVQTSHKIDPTRPTTAAMNQARNDSGYAEVSDVVVYNYGDKQLAYVKNKEAHPNRVMFCTEGTSFVCDLFSTGSYLLALVTADFKLSGTMALVLPPKN